jgi:transcriptional regulator with XRE-family HTH domain
MTGAASASPRLTQELTGRLREIRRERKISARELAARCARLGMPGLTRSAISKIESGVRARVTIEEFAILAVALDVDPGGLLSGRHQAVSAAMAASRPEERYRNALLWIRTIAGLHYFGDAFDPEHMRTLANLAADALDGKDVPDFDERMAEGKRRAQEMAEGLGFELVSGDEDLEKGMP